MLNRLLCLTIALLASATFMAPVNAADEFFAQRVLMQAQAKKAAKVLALVHPERIPTPEEIAQSGLIFFMLRAQSTVESTPSAPCEAQHLDWSIEASVMTLKHPDWATPAKVDVQKVVDEFRASGAPGNYQPGLELRIRLREKIRAGETTESSAARGLMWESDQIEELATDAFLTALRLSLALYAVVEGQLPTSLEEALAPLDAELVNSPGADLGLPCRLAVDSTRRYALWEVDTSIGATYTELLVLSEDNKSFGTAPREEQADLTRLEFPYVIFDSRANSTL